mgnify:CR=1 FL=1
MSDAQTKRSEANIIDHSSLVAELQRLELPKDYRPSDDEPFMNDRQREYFRRKLLGWKSDILREAQDTLVALQTENENHPDLADRASSETDRAIELRARDRQRKLTGKIDAALARLEDGSYGYCEETGEPISLKRLEARPIATPPAVTRWCTSSSTIHMISRRTAQTRKNRYGASLIPFAA